MLLVCAQSNLVDAGMVGSVAPKFMVVSIVLICFFVMVSSAFLFVSDRLFKWKIICLLLFLLLNEIAIPIFLYIEIKNERNRDMPR